MQGTLEKAEGTLSETLDQLTSSWEPVLCTIHQKTKQDEISAIVIL